MADVWLLVDTNYIARRALYTTGGLQYGGVSTGVSFGVLRDIEGQIEYHGANRTILAFDSRNSLRKKICPKYKANRDDKTEEQKEQDLEFYVELRRLKEELLPIVGYRNIIEVDGYEADDIIAQVALVLPSSVDAVIISADHDLLQCISDHVRFHNPSTKKTVNLRSFFDEWGLLPEDWPMVKAIAGCGTDNVEGIRGVGEKTAAQFIAGKLKKGKKYDSITCGYDVVARNLPLVGLPLGGLELPPILPDVLTEAGKIEAQQLLGIRAKRRPRDLVNQGFQI